MGVRLLYVQLGVHLLVLLPCSGVHLTSCYRRLTACVVVQVLGSGIIIPNCKELLQCRQDFIFDDLHGPVRFCVHHVLLGVLNEELLDSLLHDVDQGVEVFDFGDVVGHGGVQKVNRKLGLTPKDA